MDRFDADVLLKMLNEFYFNRWCSDDSADSLNGIDLTIQIVESYLRSVNGNAAE